MRQANPFTSRLGFWRTAEIEALRDLAARGVRASEIAATLQRTETSVRGKAIGSAIELASDRSLQPVTLRRVCLSGGEAVEI